MSFFCYILLSEKLNKFYIGHTSNVEERINSHLSNHSGFTSRVKDWVLVYSEKFSNKAEDQSREMQIKKWKSSVMIRKLIEKK